MESLLNYTGQLRAYSFIDLILFGFAIQAGRIDFIGIIFLHLGFLAYLETRHAHSYRKKFSKWIWEVVTLVGILLYRHWEVLGFLLCSYLYTKKTRGYFGVIAPLLRGFQYFFLAAGIIGYHNPLTWIALLIMFIRNFAGDLRDVVKDKKEGVRTLPLVMGLDRNMNYIHLMIMFVTSFIWWSFTTLPLGVLLLVFMLQIATYNLTPR